MKRYVIIGCGNAGLTCAKTLRSHDLDAQITIISDEDYPPYCRCLLTYYIENKADEKILFEKNESSIKRMNLNYLRNEKVEFIEPKKNRVRLSSGKKLYYDKLFIGAGASPKKSFFKSDNSILTTNLRKFDDAKKIKDNFSKGSVAVVEGGGLVSLKTLVALYEIGVKVFWVVGSPYILSFLIDRDSSKILEHIITSHGIKLIKGARIVEIKNKIVKLNNEYEIKADGVIVGKGVAANKIPSDTYIEFDDGYLVNDFFETSIENVYAGGDCAKIFDKAHNKIWKVALWPVAGTSGLFAAKNMINLKTKFKGAVPANSFSVFDNDIIAAGKKKIEKNETGNFYEYSEKKNNVFKKFIFDKNNNLKGFVFINDIFNAGSYYYKIK